MRNVEMNQVVTKQWTFGNCRLKVLQAKQGTSYDGFMHVYQSSLHSLLFSATATAERGEVGAGVTAHHCPLCTDLVVTQ